MATKIAVVFLLALFAVVSSGEKTGNAQDIVKSSFNYMRGKSSVSKVNMTIHRPDWERHVTIEAWTKGESDCIFRIIAPAKDNGNGTLKKKNEMWMYNPKINRVIKIPPSMMCQAWMGSDFSNNDLSKTDSLINDYTHTLTGTETHDGKKVYLIKSMPKPDAPVVWGMLKLKIREDNILLQEAFYDEDSELVKTLSNSNIQMIGKKLYPTVWIMKKADTKGEYTRLEYEKIAFDQNLSDNLFTLSSLKSFRR